MAECRDDITKDAVPRDEHIVYGVYRGITRLYINCRDAGIVKEYIAACCADVDVRALKCTNSVHANDVSRAKSLIGHVVGEDGYKNTRISLNGAKECARKLFEGVVGRSKYGDVFCICKCTCEASCTDECYER